MATQKIAVLESEGSIKNVSQEDLHSRTLLADAFRKLPKEVFVNLRHLQPEVGCLNRCSFCSQGAVSIVWRLSERSLKNVFSAIKTVAIEVASTYLTAEKQPYVSGNILSEEGTFVPHFKMPVFGLVGYGRTSHRPGVIYPYLDNDIASYPFLLQYIKYGKEDLGAKTRLSTVGYSRRNEQLQKMHEEINRDHLEGLGGVRLSITPYTWGWTHKGEHSGLTSRDEFTLDLANFLKTYQPAINYLGLGDRAASTEFRFPPLVSETEVEEDLILNRHVVHAGCYLLVSNTAVDVIPSFYVAKVKAEGRHSIAINEKPGEYTMVISMKLKDNSNWKAVVQSLIEKSFQNIEEVLPGCVVRQSKLYLLENDDGLYYGMDPEMTDFGYFAKEFYFVSERRSVSGYIDSERYFLNALLEYKRSKGLGRRELFSQATWQDADEVISRVEKQAVLLENVDALASAHIREYVLPIISAYRKALEVSGCPARFFFDKNFTIDTGEICNLGGAYRDYKGITSRRDSVVTPQHDRVYGLESSLAVEGTIWRIAVCPTYRAAGKRSIAMPTPSLLVEEFDPGKVSTLTGETLRHWYIPLKPEDIECIDVSQHKGSYLIPGRIPLN